MNDVWIIKLGGSIITAKKTGHPTLKKAAINRLCAEISQAVSKYPDRHFIILHGAGSFGHPLVYAHGLDKAPLTTQRMPYVSQIIRNMRFLTDAIVSELAAHGVNPISLQTSSLLSGKSSVKQTATTLHPILVAHGIPVLSGDITITATGVLNVVSADTLAVRLAQALPVTHILFASDTPGVYATFPPSPQDQPLTSLSRPELQAMTKQKTTTNAHDVTGGMLGKLQALLPLKNVKVVIFDGRKAGNMTAALQSKPIGTTIKL